jgi:hypothetical protein
MKRLAPALVVLALAAGCAKDTPSDRPTDPALHVVTVEVPGMH